MPTKSIGGTSPVIGPWELPQNVALGAGHHHAGDSLLARWHSQRGYANDGHPVWWLPTNLQKNCQRPHECVHSWVCELLLVWFSLVLSTLINIELLRCFLSLSARCLLGSRPLLHGGLAPFHEIFPKFWQGCRQSCCCLQKVQAKTMPARDHDHERLQQ